MSSVPWRQFFYVKPYKICRAFSFIPHCIYFSSLCKRIVKYLLLHVLPIEVLNPGHNMLLDYFMKESDIFSDLTLRKVGRCAYNYAFACNRRIPSSWVYRETAGLDWFTSFLKNRKNCPLGSLKQHAWFAHNF